MGKRSKEKNITLGLLTKKSKFDKLTLEKTLSILFQFY